jgi:hypothetical protein
MRSWIGLAAVVALASGCVPDRGAFTFKAQPDGSGTVDVQAVCPRPLLTFGAAAPGRAQDEAVAWLRRVDGVVAWTDVVAAVGSDGATRVSARGWYPALGAVTRDGKPIFDVAAVATSLELVYRDPVLAGLQAPGNRDKTREGLTATDEELATQMRFARGALMIALSGWSADIAVELPAAPDVVEGFEPGLRLHHDGDTVDAWITAELAAFKALRRAVRAGELDVDAAVERWTSRAHAAPRARCPLTSTAVDPAFREAMQRALAEWTTSEWRRRVERR